MKTLAQMVGNHYFTLTHGTYSMLKAQERVAAGTLHERRGALAVTVFTRRSTDIRGETLLLGREEGIVVIEVSSTVPGVL